MRSKRFIGTTLKLINYVCIDLCAYRLCTNVYCFKLCNGTPHNIRRTIRDGLGKNENNILMLVIKLYKLIIAK